MAIFGKKKSDKDKAAAGGPTSADSISSLSPSLEGSAGKAAGAQALREGSKIPGPSSSSSHTMGNKGSISGAGSAGVGSGFGTPGGGPPSAAAAAAQQQQQQQQHQQQQQPPQQQQQPPSQIPGPPGAASGFKFGGQPPGPRPDMGMANGSGIPPPSSGPGRLRQVSNDSSAGPHGYGMAGMGSGGIGSGPQGPGGSISGLPPSSSGPGLPLSASANSVPAGASGPGTSSIPMGPGSAGTDKVRSQQVVYPWSQRGIVMNPPRFLDETRQAPPGALSPFPFPRYGHAANQTASPNGEIYLFGGLVRESVKNDLYTVYVDRLASSPPNPSSPPGGAGGAIQPQHQLYASATLVQTTGEIPPPRVGHATVLVSNVLILWGGDTKVRADDKQDEGLYLLNLSTREWTRVKAASDGPDSAPVGRYGHTVWIIGSKFYVFGGQVDGAFLNDFWSFDLNSLKGTPTWERITPNSELPPKRTGHVSVTYKDRVYIFGGTDGQYHYNDTWCYDVPSNTWKELSCIGYIPVPREGHATCLVDDVMYIFGGRGVDGKDLGDLASFKISNQRWYMFANMGPSPTGRSGHALAAYQNKVVVLGGESFNAGVKPDDPSMIHVLDTAKIKYPPDNPSQRSGSGSGSNGRKSSLPGGITAPGAQQPQGQSGPGSGSLRGAMSPVAEEEAAARSRATSPTQRGAPGAPMRPLNGLVGMSQQPDSPGSAGSHHLQQRQAQPMVLPQQQQPYAQQQQQGGPQSPPYHAQNIMSMAQAGAMQSAGEQQPTRAMSPSSNALRDPRAAPLPGASQQGQPSFGQMGGPQQQQPQQQQPYQHGLQQPQPDGPAPYGGPRSQRSIENMRGGAPSPNSVAPASAMRNIDGVLGRNDSPATTPQDAFHYGRNGTPPSANSAANGYHPASRSANAELEAMRRREAWLKAALAMAAKKGFVEPEQLQMPDGTSVEGRSDTPDRVSLDGFDTGPEGSEKDRIFKALVSLKTQLASAKSTIAQQAQGEADRMAESERARSAALQEAAYYRAKLAALESGNVAEVSRLDRERAAKFEKSLAEALRESAQLERQVSSLREQAKLEQQLRNSAEERLSETAKRAMAAEAAQMKAYDELSALQKRSHASESSLRDYAEQVATLSSIAARHRADHEHARSQLDSHKTSVDTHVRALAELQAAHAAVQARAAEHERQHAEQRGLAQQHAATIAELQAQLEAKAQEAYAHSSRSAELETLLSQHRHEAETHRAAASGGLAALLAQQQQQQQQLNASRDLGSGADGVPSHVEDKMRALEEEAESLRELHGQARQAADSHSAALQEMRERNLALEKQHAALRTELSAMRSQLTVALQEVARLKDTAGSKDIELRDRSRAVEAAQVKASLLKQFMADRGVSVPNDDELSVKSGYADRRIRELEDEIDARTREVQDAEHRLQDSESRVEELTRELEHQASRRASRVAGADSAALAEAQERATRAEDELAETTASYKERMAQLENDYQTAVQFVKGTEKMLRRMKDELTKNKTENAQLQSEVAALRSGQLNPAEDGGAAASEEAARDIEALRHRLADVTQQSEEIAAENRELERRIAALSAGERPREGEPPSSRKVAELQDQVERLEAQLGEARKEIDETLSHNQHLGRELGGSGSGGGKPSAEATAALGRDLTQSKTANEQLRRENAALNAKCAELEDKFQLLLGKMETTHGDDEAQRDSIMYGSITSELDKWERDRSLGSAMAQREEGDDDDAFDGETTARS
ncbi:related to KEL1 - involved in cell fusion and morphology [Pseudozyma flocculosa]|uniref:Related to KEL1 - involved in cell fusion and morphology n=1 Tax=Pseudozyma flocculosa TaxID=84751 RepID=A0A5C3FAI9_9BASI|nr:related to KEL1 - involved in cell fusion and morphology [Pseudozyma flocculosa]